VDKRQPPGAGGGASAAGTLPPGGKTAADAARLVCNDRVDAAVAAFVLVAVLVIIAESAREWARSLDGSSRILSAEVPYSARGAVAGD